MTCLALWIGTLECVLAFDWGQPSRKPSGQNFLAATALVAAEVDPLAEFATEHAAFQRLASSAGNGLHAASFTRDANAQNESREVVWVTGFPRTGSSTLLSMVSVQPNASNESSLTGVFSLFEPCHDGDELDARLQSRGCGGLLGELSQCNFEQVRSLWGWHDPHSSGVRKDYQHDVAHSMCEHSSRITFKTVDYGHNATEMLQLLHRIPSLRIIASVRDPRGIWASWKTQEPFATFMKEGNFYSLEDICQSFASNIEIDHPRLRRVKFERMVTDPFDVSLSIYRWLGIDYGAAQRDWVRSNFNNKSCPPPPSWQVGFDDCREDSAKVAEHWREVLTEEDLRRFNKDENCQKVKAHYAFGD